MVLYEGVLLKRSQDTALSPGSRREMSEVSGKWHRLQQATVDPEGR